MNDIKVPTNICIRLRTEEDRRLYAELVAHATQERRSLNNTALLVLQRGLEALRIPNGNYIAGIAPQAPGEAKASKRYPIPPLSQTTFKGDN